MTITNDPIIYEGLVAEIFILGTLKIVLSASIDQFISSMILNTQCKNYTHYLSLIRCILKPKN